jgi:indole-3-glycerol phosphate synthase
VTTYLDRIVDAHRAAAAVDTRPLDALVDASQRAEPPRGFTAALRSKAFGRGHRLAVVAEVKRQSPSKGDLTAGARLDAAVLARAYQAGGASALSVLTDAEFFDGSSTDLAAARDATAIPVLRKDFTVSPRDVCDARLMGADAVLLIAAALDDSELADFHDLAVEVGFDAVVEVHDEDEVARALDVGAAVIGVNQRDLLTFEVDTDRACRVAPAIPDHVVRLAESGIRGRDDARRLAEAGYDAILVGESLVRSADPAAAVAALREPFD